MNSLQAPYFNLIPSPGCANFKSAMPQNLTTIETLEKSADEGRLQLSSLLDSEAIDNGIADLLHTFDKFRSLANRATSHVPLVSDRTIGRSHHIGQYHENERAVWSIRMWS